MANCVCTALLSLLLSTWGLAPPRLASVREQASGVQLILFYGGKDAEEAAEGRKLAGRMAMRYESVGVSVELVNEGRLHRARSDERSGHSRLLRDRQAIQFARDRGAHYVGGVEAISPLGKVGGDKGSLHSLWGYNLLTFSHRAYVFDSESNPVWPLPLGDQGADSLWKPQTNSTLTPIVSQLLSAYNLGRAMWRLPRRTMLRRKPL